VDGSPRLKSRVGRRGEDVRKNAITCVSVRRVTPAAPCESWLDDCTADASSMLDDFSVASSSR